MTEPLIAWRPGWVSEWDNGVLICIRADQRTTPAAIPAPDAQRPPQPTVTVHHA